MSNYNEALILGFAENKTQTALLAKQQQLSFKIVGQHQFPDGETQISLPTMLPDTLIIFRSLYHPNDKLISLLLMVKTARDQGVKRIILVAPYLCYMRQDKAFQPGDIISQQIIGDWLATLFDAVITVDAHLHRIDSLQQAIPRITAINLFATTVMTDYLNQYIDSPLLVGPDAESVQWVKRIAEAGRFDYVIAEKKRFSDVEVEVEIPDYDYAYRHIVLLDDVASTGKTLLAAADQLLIHQPASITVMVAHALLSDEACEALYNAGVDQIISGDSIPHHTNAMSLIPLVSTALTDLLQT